mmetsp:Transcript_52166/g.110875  ORF Transcript_52166/g.110875 Transcript_52166/m.110875 type:complete len:245 (-) Transcript_52166:318-1052(-)
MPHWHRRGVRVHQKGIPIEKRGRGVPKSEEVRGNRGERRGRHRLPNPREGRCVEQKLQPGGQQKGASVAVSPRAPTGARFSPAEHILERRGGHTDGRQEGTGRVRRVGRCHGWAGVRGQSMGFCHGGSRALPERVPLAGAEEQGGGARSLWEARRLRRRERGPNKNKAVHDQGDIAPVCRRAQCEALSCGVGRDGGIAQKVCQGIETKSKFRAAGAASFIGTHHGNCVNSSQRGGAISQSRRKP